MVAGSIAAAFSKPLVPEETTADHWLDLVGWIMLAMGMAVRAWSIAEIGGRKRVTVVDTGPYALCRNPLYVGTLLIAVSQLWIVRSLSFLIAILVLIWVYVAGVVPAEERYLTETLGDEYLDYCRRTPRWFPLWSANVRRSQRESSVASRREFLTLPCWLIFPLLSEALTHVRQIENWPLPLPF